MGKEGYTPKHDCALPGGRLRGRVTVSEGKLVNMNKGSMPDKEYMKANFVPGGTEVDDPRKVETYQIQLIQGQVPFHKDASEEDLKKLMDLMQGKKSKKGTPSEDGPDIEECRAILEKADVPFSKTLGLKKLRKLVKEVEDDDPID